MARESFEDPEIARLLNEHFVSIKVDREERPDLDQIYMEAVQAMTGNGGWPLSVFSPRVRAVLRRHVLAAARAPAGGMAGFDQVLQAVADAWRTGATRCGGRPAGSRACCKSHEPAAASFRPDASLAAESAGRNIAGRPKSALRRVVRSGPRRLLPAPKFPQPLALRWLLRRWRRTGDDELAADGRRDARRHGRRRDLRSSRRRVSPLHGRRPLADAPFREDALRQRHAGRCLRRGLAGDRPAALRRRRAADARLSAGRPRPIRRAVSTVPRTPTAKAEKARSTLWTPGEVEAVLEPRSAKTFCRMYDVTDEGNFEGGNILSSSAGGKVGGQSASRGDAAREPGAS